MKYEVRIYGLYEIEVSQIFDTEKAASDYLKSWVLENVENDIEEIFQELEEYKEADSDEYSFYIFEWKNEEEYIKVIEEEYEEE